MKKFLKKTPIFVGALFGIFYLAYGALYLAGYRWYQIPTSGMNPTIPTGGHVIGRLSEKYRDHIGRFQIVLYVPDDAPGSTYVKRVIGLPGERVTVSESSIAIDGVKLDLPSAIRTQGLGVKKCDFFMPEDAVFVLGDNAANSMDSRYVGGIPKKNVIGRVLFKD